MAGLYVHIPFCRSKCHYCDFYSLPRLSLAERYVAALLSEARLHRCVGSSVFRASSSEGIGTVYVGGGTPSLLSLPLLRRVMEGLRALLPLTQVVECTVEVNPDDVTAELVEGLVSLGINRVSMGVQSFNDALLRSVGRRHTSRQALEAVRLLQTSGVANISIDLIYGLPGETLPSWRDTLRCATSLGVQHISAYGLSYERGTRLWAMLQAGKVAAVSDDEIVAMYGELVSHLRSAGFEHYEISNFALPGFASRHNSAYWTLSPYIGLGAAAHSFDGNTRWSNEANVSHYLSSIESGRLPGVPEVLTSLERRNELVMLSLRTSRGIDVQELEARFGERSRKAFENKARQFVEHGLMRRSGTRYALTEDAIMTSDSIISDFFE